MKKYSSYDQKVTCSRSKVKVKLQFFWSIFSNFAFKTILICYNKPWTVPNWSKWCTLLPMEEKVTIWPEGHILKVKGQGQITQFCPILSNFVFKTTLLLTNRPWNIYYYLHRLHINRLWQNMYYMIQLQHAKGQRSRSNNSILPNIIQFCIQN